MAVSFNPYIAPLLPNTIDFLSRQEAALCQRVSRTWHNQLVQSPKVPRPLRPGVIGATHIHPMGPLFFRRERLTQENSPHWVQFQKATYHLMREKKFVEVVINAYNKKPFDASIAEATGYTAEEYLIFQEELHALGKKIKGIITTLKCVTGAFVGFHPEFSLNKDAYYVVYATNDPNFSIPLSKGALNFKEYRNLYGSLIILVGSSSARTNIGFTNRGIIRPPNLNQYNNLSMLLHGFSGACEDNLPPGKMFMNVMPLPYMQKIIKESLLRGEGFINLRSPKPIHPLVIPEGGFQDEFEEYEAREARYITKIDILDHSIDWNHENPNNTICLSALLRLYYTHRFTEV